MSTPLIGIYRLSVRLMGMRVTGGMWGGGVVSGCGGGDVSEFVETRGEVDHEGGGSFVGLSERYAYAELLDVDSGAG